MDCAVGFVLRNLVTRKVSSNSKTIEIFYDFLGGESPVTSETRFLRESRELGNNSS